MMSPGQERWVDHVRSRARVVALCLGLCPAVFGCGGTPAQRPAAPNEGRIALRAWDVKAARWLDENQVRERLVRARVLLLGEQHDHPEHHLRQAEVMRWLAEAGRRPAVVFEMLETSQQVELDNLTANPGSPESTQRPTKPAGERASATERADALAAKVDWEHSGWPDWAMYRPIFVEAFAYGLPLIAGGLPDDVVHAAMQRGLGALPAALARDYALDVPLPDALQRSLLSQLDEAHCGLLPEALHAPMALVQRARDAQMAHSLREHATDDGAVLIAGTGHVRRDRGVPWYLRRQGVESLSVAFIASPSTDEAPEIPSEDAIYDIVWWTAPLEQAAADPCAELRRRHGAAAPTGRRNVGKLLAKRRRST
jgi:uncharacterized iron-regulated protein